ncbi:MAG: hypothetical protein M0Z94_17475 [Dehalococcoidales bacterium]|nr:hypothetical protein [Dehalococcoidales bacterium]
MPPPERFGLPDRYDTIGSDRLSAFVFFLTFALVAGTVVFFALGSGWGFPEMPGLIPAPTRDNSLFPSAQATAEPTAEPTASSVMPTQTPTPTPQPTPAQTVYVVGNTGGDGGVWLRRSPNLSDKMLIWHDGNRMERIGPDVNAGGMVWIHVRDPRGNEGYIPAQWLIPVS